MDTRNDIYERDTTCYLMCIMVSFHSSFDMGLLALLASISFVNID